MSQDSDTVPLAADDVDWLRVKERRIVRDALLSDSELESYRLTVQRSIAAQKARGTPAWWQQATSIRAEAIDEEIKARRALVKYGGPNYDPVGWWQERVDRIREQASRDLVWIMLESRQVTLDGPRANGDLWGRCPIHQERTASLHVEIDTGLWHCFGCGAGGDVFTWLELVNGLVFREAVVWLAERYRIDMTPPPSRLRALGA